MKKLFFATLVFTATICFSVNLYASRKAGLFFNSENFVKSVKEAMLEDHNALTAKVSPYLRIVRDSGAPNCFECSLYLIKTTLDADGEMQLVAADLAVKFSPELPEAQLHYLMRLMKFSPFSGGRIFKSVKDTVRTFFNFPPRDAFFYSILNRFSNGCIFFLIIFFIIMLFKYPSALLHRYMHLCGFSRFYAISVFVAVTTSSIILATNDFAWLLVLMTFTMFFSGVAALREKIVMHTVLAICILTEGAIVLTGVNENASVDKNIAMTNFSGVYSPVLVGIDDPNTDFPGGSFAKGAMFYYSGNFDRAAFHFKRELNNVKDKKIKNSLDNFLGLSLARQGNYAESAEHLKASYEESKNYRIGYNLARILYESGRAPEATVIEKHILENAGAITLSFPYHYYPEMYRMWRYVSSGKTGESLDVWVKFLLFFLGVIISYIILLLVRMNYLRGINLNKCLECGAVICSSCHPGSNTYSCVVCRLMKAKPDLFKKGESILYENQREGHFSRYSFFTTLFTFITPGGGLIFSDKITEGAVYLFVTVLILTQICQSDWRMIYNIDPGSGGAIIIIFAILAGVIYLLSVVRGFFASRDM